MFVFWRGQVAVSLFAGIVTAIFGGGIGTIAPHLVRASAVAVVVGYLAMLGIFFVFAVMRAPVNLDRQRASEIAEKDLALVEKDTKIAVLQEVISRKHPADEYKENQVRSMIRIFNGEDLEMLRLLLHSGEMNEGPFNRDMIGKAKGCGLVNERIERTVGGNYTFYRINPNYEEALKDILHPPRPVGPPTA